MTQQADSVDIELLDSITTADPDVPVVRERSWTAAGFALAFGALVVLIVLLIRMVLPEYLEMLN